jgi:hypothetical protein
MRRSACLLLLCLGLFTSARLPSPSPLHGIHADASSRHREQSVEVASQAPGKDASSVVSHQDAVGKHHAEHISVPEAASAGYLDVVSELGSR